MERSELDNREKDQKEPLMMKTRHLVKVEEPQEEGREMKNRKSKKNKQKRRAVPHSLGCRDA